jgi:hypothetical protein
MTRRVLSIALAAGAAASVSMAQQREFAEGPAPKGARAQAAASRRVVYVDPIAVYVNGRQVPFTVGDPTDANAITYDNVTGTTGNFVVPLPPGNTVLPQTALDDINLTTTGPQRITGFRPAFATGTTVTNPACNMAVGFAWHNSLNPAAVPPAPVNTAGTPIVTVVFGPGAGWAPNTTYTATNFVFFQDGPTVSSSGAGEVFMLSTTTCTGTTVANVLNPDFTPVYSSGGTVGTSTPAIWLDGANNQPVDGVYTSAEQVDLTPGTTLRIALATNAASTSPTGRCCLANGSCILATSAQCTGLGGTYGGDGTTCAGPCPTAPVLWNNGPLATGTISLGGNTAPGGAQWSEVPKDGTSGCTLNVAGFGGAGALRLADDFVVPAGQTWNLTSVTLFGYLTNGTTTAPPWTTITLRIIRDDPDTGPVVFGDTTTNLLTNPTTQASFANIWRIFNSQGNANGTANRPVWQFEVPAVVSLPSGHYYVDFNYGPGGFVPPVSPMAVQGTANGFGVTAIEGANARQFLSGTGLNRYFWAGSAGATVTASGANNCLATTNELPFIVRGTSTGGGSTCYPNCDGSTTVPFLNVLDFSCFLNKFASGNTYANCDLSTTPPVLNVLDFSCFLNKFAAGCSAP